MHRNADLDALASAYFLSFIYAPAIIAADGLDRFARQFASRFSIDVKSEVSGEFEKIITVDTASREQLGKFKDVRIEAVYDHHESNNIVAPELHVDSSYPSCAEMLYSMFSDVEFEDDAPYLLLLGGIISDTRWFRHANSRSFAIAAEIIGRIKGDFSEYAEMYDMARNFGERVSIMKGFQRVKYRSKGSRIIAATKVSAHESSVAVMLVEIADVVFVASQKKDAVRISARSRGANLLEIFSEVAADFHCDYGGHPEAAGMSCTGDAEAVLNALLINAEKLL